MGKKWLCIFVTALIAINKRNILSDIPINIRFKTPDFLWMNEFTTWYPG